MPALWPRNPRLEDGAMKSVDWSDPLTAAKNAMAILDALKPSDADTHVWYEIGRAVMTLKLAIPREHEGQQP